jgi:hypothetical protein
MVVSSGYVAARILKFVTVERHHPKGRANFWPPVSASKNSVPGVFAASGQARTFDYQAGDVGYVPFAMGHYIENAGTTPLRFLEVFKSSYYADVSLNQWLALTPAELVKAHLKLDTAALDALHKEKYPVVPA